MKFKDLATLKEEIIFEVKQLSKKEASFVLSYQTDSYNAMNWSTSLFEAAAKKKVLLSILAMIEGEKSLDFIISVIKERAIRHAKYPSFSTSPASNLLHIYEGSAWAYLTENFEND